MKHRASSTHRIDAPDRHNGQTHKQTNGLVSLSICVLDGFLHKDCMTSPLSEVRREIVPDAKSSCTEGSAADGPRPTDEKRRPIQVSAERRLLGSSLQAPKN